MYNTVQRIKQGINRYKYSDRAGMRLPVRKSQCWPRISQEMRRHWETSLYWCEHRIRTASGSLLVMIEPQVWLVIGWSCRMQKWWPSSSSQLFTSLVRSAKISLGAVASAWSKLDWEVVRPKTRWSSQWSPAFPDRWFLRLHSDLCKDYARGYRWLDIILATRPREETSSTNRQPLGLDILRFGTNEAHCYHPLEFSL